MEQLNLHADGRDHHLSALKESYEALKNKIMANVKLSNSDRTSELKKAKVSYDKAKADANRNLY
jgi:hypothetical protein